MHDITYLCVSLCDEKNKANNYLNGFGQEQADYRFLCTCKEANMLYSILACVFPSITTVALLQFEPTTTT